MPEKTLDPPRQDGRNDARTWAPEPRRAERELAARATSDRQVWARIREVLEDDQGRVVPFAELAQACELSVSEVREEVAAMAVAWSDGDRHPPLNHGALRPYLQVHGARLDFYNDVFNSLVYPSPYVVEELVVDEDYVRLDALLAEVDMPSPGLPDGAPQLAWRNGEALSEAAVHWYTTHLLSETHYFQRGLAPDEARHKPVRGAAELVTPGLSDESLAAFVRWVVRQRLPDALQASIPEGSKVAVDALGALKMDGGLRRPLESVRGVDRTESYVLWRARWGLPHPPDMLERHWPREDEPSGTLDFWKAMAVHTLERALAQRRAFGYYHLRNNYLWHPVARDAVEGAVFRTDEGRLVWARDGKLVDADGTVRLGPDDTLVLAHPATDLEDWPDVPVEDQFAQRTRSVLDSDDLPELPVEPLAHDLWRERARKLALYGLLAEDYGNGRNRRGANTTHAYLAMGDRQLYIKHNGYGDGYGGPSRPVQIEEFRLGRTEHDGPVHAAEKTSGWDQLPADLRSEAILLMRQILGEAPLPDVPEQMGPPQEPSGADESTESDALGKGSRVRVTSGKDEGVEGRVFWFGDSKFGPGKRVGIKGDDGETYWLDADDVEVI